MTNPFSHPHLSRSELLERKLVHYNADDYRGKSILYVFFTRHCGVGCPFCFFKSAPARQEVTLADEFSEEGIDKYIDFANRSNLGYLAISGGGEPLNHRRATLRSIAEIRCDRIVMNTSGSWAVSRAGAIRYVEDIHRAFQQRETPCPVVVRVSVSEGHSIKLGIKPALNLIEIFRQQYREHPYLELQLHAFKGDPTLAKILEHYPDAQLVEDERPRISADEKVVKVMPGKVVVSFADGFRLTVGYTRMFSSGLRPNLHDEAAYQQSSKVFMEDLDHSEDFFPSIVENTDGSKGIDWAINYNGNTCPWTNQVNDNQYNFYEDDYQTILHGTLSDPLMLANMEKGTQYRDRIVAEVDPVAVRRLRGISLRDYSGTVIFEEEKTRLYFTLRVLQDFYKEGRLLEANLSRLSQPLRQLIEGSKEDLVQAFQSVHYTIVDQYKRRSVFDPTEWHDLLELIKLGHYDLTKEQIQEALDYYNLHATGPRVDSIEEVQHGSGDIERRLTERLMYMKPLGSAQNTAETDSRELAII